MKYVFFTIVLIAVFAFHPFKKKKVIFFGDSITQQGAGPSGYIPKIDSLCKVDNLQDNFEFVGKGVSGNRVYDLFYRFQEDVLDQKPDIVIVYIGINDVWHKVTNGTGTEYKKFGEFYDKMVTRMKREGIQVVMCTPSVIGERNDMTNQLDGDLNYYAKWVRDYAAQNNIPLVDLRKDFLSYLEKNNSQNKEKGVLTVDGVHMNSTGNLFLAKEMWGVLKPLK